MGPSGCGKSTLLGVLGLTIPPTSGSVLVNGVPAPSDPDGRARTRNRLLGLIPQSGAVIDHLSVLAARARSVRAGSTSMVAARKAVRRVVS